MDMMQSVLLGLIQGLTEFLPVSSSAHLSALPAIFGIKSALLNSLAFDVTLHAGTLAAVLFYFRKRLIPLITGFFRGCASREARGRDFRVSLHIITATVPAVIAAVLAGDMIEGFFRNPVLTGVALILFGLLLWAADKSGAKDKAAEKMGIAGAILTGAAQALALIPGVSRSGITMTAGLFLGLKKEEAAEFSFLLSIPAIAGAFVFKLKDIIEAGTGGSAAVLMAGFIAAALSGFFSIAFLMRFIRTNSFTPFVAYRLVLGAFIIIMALRAAG